MYLSQNESKCLIRQSGGWTTPTVTEENIMMMIVYGFYTRIHWWLPECVWCCKEKKFVFVVKCYILKVWNKKPDAPIVNNDFFVNNSLYEYQTKANSNFSLSHVLKWIEGESKQKCDKKPFFV